MITGMDWPNPQIFECYRSLAPHHEYAGKAKKRIGMYTFQFHDDGVTIQRNIVGTVEATWEIRQSNFGTVEAAIQNYWTLLQWMSQNSMDRIKLELDRLAEKAQ